MRRKKLLDKSKNHEQKQVTTYKASEKIKLEIPQNKLVKTCFKFSMRDLRSIATSRSASIP